MQATRTTNVRELVSSEEWQARLDLAALYRLTALYHWDDLIFTHISMRLPAEPTSLADVQHNLALAREPLVKEVARSALTQGDLRVSEYHSQVYTDDLAPVERLIDSIIFSYATGQER